MIYILITLILIIALVLIRAHYEVTHFQIKEYKFKHSEINHKIRIAYLSDLHACSYGEKNEKLADKIRKMNPDAVVIGGDLILGKTKKIQTQEALDFLAQIDGLCPIIYTYGNHETRIRNTKEFQKYEKELEKYQVTILNNKRVTLQLHGENVEIYGLELGKEFYKKNHQNKEFKGEDWFLNKSEKDGRKMQILVAHDPKYFNEYKLSEANYVLSGHNHGGIVRLPFIKGVIATDWHLFPKYSYGVYKNGNMKMILTSGIGTHTIKFRLFNMSEIVQLDLIPNNKDS